MNQDVLRFLRQKGLRIPQDILSLAEVESRVFDIVIYVKMPLVPPRLSGNPIVVQWKIPPYSSEKECCAACFPVLSELVAGFFEQGYLAALLQARRNFFLILDNLREGIMAHDLNRRIFYFNKAAEEITGYQKEEVLGRDCHEVFPNKFCGKSCGFCNGMTAIPTAPYSYDISAQARDGTQKRLGMSVVPIFAFEKEGRSADKSVLGVLATFVDNTREFELSSRLGELKQFAGIVGNSPAMIDLYETIRDVANSDIPVLIQGESGTGKELVAHAIHNESYRSQRLFVPVNCAALPDSLLESELFGHVRGAFTGAIRDKKGRFELADGGTLFLDEIGDISPAMQAKLLRVLQDGVFERVGGEKSMRVNVRIISATNKDLRKEVEAGRFREDLFYRVCVMPIWLPPLRERAADIPLLVEHMLKRIQETGSLPYKPSVTNEAMDIFLQYSWQGNVRELMNCLQYAAVRARGKPMEPQHLPASIFSAATAPSSSGIQARPVSSLSDQSSQRPTDEGDLSFLRPRTAIFTLQTISDALKKAGGNRTLAAKALGVSRATFYRLLNRYARQL